MATDPFVQLAIETIPDLRDGPLWGEAQQKLDQAHREGRLLGLRSLTETSVDGFFSNQVLIRYLVRALRADDRPSLDRVLALTDAYLDSGDVAAIRAAEGLLKSWSFPLSDPEIATQPGGKSRSFLQDLDRKWKPWWPVVRILDDVIMELFSAARDVHPSIEFESSRNVGMRSGHFHEYLGLYWDRVYQEGEDVYLEFSVGPNYVASIVTGQRVWPDGPASDFARFELYHWSGNPSASLGPLFLPFEAFGPEYMDSVIALAREAADLTRQMLDPLVAALADPLIDRQRPDP